MLTLPISTGSKNCVPQFLLSPCFSLLLISRDMQFLHRCLHMKDSDTFFICLKKVWPLSSAWWFFQHLTTMCFQWIMHIITQTKGAPLTSKISCISRVLASSLGIPPLKWPSLLLQWVTWLSAIFKQLPFPSVLNTLAVYVTNYLACKFIISLLENGFY